jgi:hypothetical protein
VATQCEACGIVVYRRRLKLEEPNKGKFLGFECGCLAADRIPRSTANPFSIEFQHVNDEFGRHLKVDSIRELERAEKRLGFQSVVLNSDAQNFDDPPQQKPINMADIHQWKFSDRERYRRRFA